MERLNAFHFERLPSNINFYVISSFCCYGFDITANIICSKNPDKEKLSQYECGLNLLMMQELNLILDFI